MSLVSALGLPSNLPRACQEVQPQPFAGVAARVGFGARGGVRAFSAQDARARHIEQTNKYSIGVEWNYYEFIR